MEYFPRDTISEAAIVQAEIFRRMTPERRLRIALEMGDSLRRFVAAGVRLRHPDYSEQQVKLAVFRLTLGDELFGKAYPEVDIAV